MKELQWNVSSCKPQQSMHSMDKSDNNRAISSEELFKKAAGSVEAEWGI